VAGVAASGCAGVVATAGLAIVLVMSLLIGGVSFLYRSVFSSDLWFASRILAIGSWFNPRLEPTDPCPGPAVPTIAHPATIGPWGPDQVTNADTIITVGDTLPAVTCSDQMVALMAAMTESSLVNTTSGDRDSVGLFQMRPSQGWGKVKDLLDTTYASTQFYSHLTTIGGRDQMDLGAQAQAVEQSAYPDRYMTHLQAMIVLFYTLTGPPHDPIVDAICALYQSDVTAIPVPGCAAPHGGSPTLVGDWAWPVPQGSPVTSPFGWRTYPIAEHHDGMDIAVAGGTPIYALHDGTVTNIIPGTDRQVGWITVDMGGGVSYSYLHEYASSNLVSVGQSVIAGQQLTSVGCAGSASGYCTGPHLDLRINVSGQWVDPDAFLAPYGIQY